MILKKTINSNNKNLSSQLDTKTKKNNIINRKDNDISFSFSYFNFYLFIKTRF